MRDGIPEINWQLKSPEEVAIEQAKLRAGKCIYPNCEMDSAVPYKLCREHILPLLDIMHNNAWISDRTFLEQAGAPKEIIEEYGKSVKYGFEL